MKLLKIALLVIVVVLSVAAGIPKILQMPQEIEFLGAIGLGNALVVLFGILQLLGGLLLIPARTRVVGGVLATLALAVSAGALLVAGNTVFGLVSLLPTLLAAYVTYDSYTGHATGSDKQ